MSDWNNNVIDEFRASGGAVGEPFQGRPLLLLHHTGARTGTKRVSPLMYQKVETGYAVFASKGGADTNPDWFHNISANPETTIEVGDRTIDVRARVVHGAERSEIWERQTQEYPQFGDYARKTSRREIPVIVLESVRG